MRCKFTSPDIWQVSNRAKQFREFAQNGAVTSVNLERAEEWARLRTHCPRTLYIQDWKLIEIYWRCTRLRITAQQDFSCARVVCNSIKTEGRMGGWQGDAAAGLLTNILQNVHQNIVFDCQVRSSKRFRRRFCRNWFFIQHIRILLGIWCQSWWQGQLWPVQVQLELRMIKSMCIGCW